jgi:hypothetical protein
MGITRARWFKNVLNYIDTQRSPDNDELWRNCPLLAIAGNPQAGFVWFDDFHGYTSGGDGGLTSTTTDSGGAQVVAGVGGILELDASDGTVGDNDEVYVGGTDTVITLSSSTECWFEARVKFTEANTDDANIIVGLSSTYAAQTLVDNGGGPPADYSGAVFFKVDGGTVWQTEVSESTSQSTNTSVATRTSGSYARLGFYANGTSSIKFYIDGIEVAEETSNLPTSAVSPLFGLKNGDTNEEKLDVDWFRLVMYPR